MIAMTLGSREEQNEKNSWRFSKRINHQRSQVEK